MAPLRGKPGGKCTLTSRDEYLCFILRGKGAFWKLSGSLVRVDGGCFQCASLQRRRQGAADRGAACAVGLSLRLR